MKIRFKITPAVYLVLRNKGKLLLLRRYNTGYRDGYYSMVAGHLDGGETMREALAREAQEEAGITVKPENLKLVHTMHLKSELEGTNDDERMTFYFEASAFEGTPRIMEADKCDEIQWFAPSTLPTPIIDHVQQALECIEKGIDYSEFGW